MANTVLRQYLSRLLHRDSLTRREAAELLEAMLAADASDAQIAATLVALAAKGETVEELAGMAEALRARAVRVNCRYASFIDTAGTGSSRVSPMFIRTGYGTPSRCGRWNTW